MRKILKNKIPKCLLSAVLFGVIYSILSFAGSGYVEIGTIIKSTISYFLIMCLLYSIAPKLRKIIGHDKENS
jgi:hypothetical protein